ncbi:MAG: hypothetical protein GY715_19450 [Planctomycetes bacterium]|nr:hypothetical protein [Planctomycetota bacterium]
MRRTRLIAAAAIIALAGPATAGDPTHALVGFDDLEARLGAATPTGAGVVVAEIEARIQTQDNAYGPNQEFSDFAGKTFHEMSPAPLVNVSNHATAVAKFQYGVHRSIAPGITEVYLYAANNWISSDYLRNSGGSAVFPVTPPPGGIKCMNHSWIADLGANSNREAIRRSDWVVNQDDMIMTVGVANEPPMPPLMSNMFNGITVGIHAGSHVFTDTPAGQDGPGRMRPVIVAPEAFTSFATPIVNAGCSLLVETARTEMASNPAAERSDVIKAAILAGCDHNGSWTNEPDTSGPTRGITDRPIDNVQGAGRLNIDRSHLVHTGGEQDGAMMPPAVQNITWRGWDLENVGIDESRYWRFELSETAAEISILATWHRMVHSVLGTGPADLAVPYTLADFDLVLWRVDAQGDLQSLVGDAGLPYFAGGNVVSSSAVDNVEHLHVTDLVAGEYVIQVDRIDAIHSPLNSFDVVVAWLLPEPAPIPEDVNGDGVVNFADILTVIGAWGPCPGCPEDIDGNGVVGFAEILAIIGAWSG